VADPKIRIKRSAVAGRIPSVDQVPLGELALNTWDGHLYASKNVGLGTTVVAINPWLVGTGTNTYNSYFTAGNIGIGSTTPTSKLHVVGDTYVSGVVTANAGFNLGISSGGSVITSGPIKTLNFIGLGNTFLINGTTVDISIQGGSGGEIGVQANGSVVGYAQTTLNFVGSGVTGVSIGTTTTITIEPGLVGAAKSVTSFTATAGQTTFNVNYSQGQENVFLNGVRLSESQYTATSGSSIILNDPVGDGDSIDIVVYLRGSDPNRNVEVTLLPPFNGITTAFTMYKGTTSYLFDPIDERQIVVSLGGVVQQPGVAYTVGTGSSIFFSSAPGAGVSCFITALYSNTVGVPTDAVKLNKQTYTPTGIQTTFTVTEGYRSGYLDVYRNGIRLVDGSDFTASNGSTFDLVTPATGGDVVDIIAYQTLNIQYSEFAGLSTNVDGGYGSLTNLQVSGISTLGNVLIGVGGTDLLVKGNARVTGILTVGPGSITFDGINNKITGITETQTTNTLVTGIATFSNGPVVIGQGSTDTSNALQIIKTLGGAIQVRGEVNSIGSTSLMFDCPRGQARVMATGPDASTKGTLTFITMSSNATQYVEAMRITKDARIGIGNTDPDKPLVIKAPNPGNYITEISNTQNSINANGLYVNTVNTAATTQPLNVQGSLIVDGAGNVGVGSDRPTLRLDTLITTANLSSGTVLTSHPIAQFINSAAGQRGLEIGSPSGGMGGPVYLKVSGTANRFAVLNQNNNENLTILDTGTVGIGTSNPGVAFAGQGTEKLQITGGNLRLSSGRKVNRSYPLILSTMESSNNMELIFQQEGSSYYSIQSVNQSVEYTPLSLQPAGGSIGIGTTNPRASFQVSSAPTPNGQIFAMFGNQNDRKQSDYQRAYGTNRPVIIIGNNNRATDGAYGLLGLYSGDTTPSTSTYLGIVEFAMPESGKTNPNASLKAFIGGQSIGSGGATGGFGGAIVFSCLSDNGGGVPTERFRVSPDGVTFNGDTAAANALDDYEEGTWTPTLINGGTMGIGAATYTKIGRLVTVYTYLTNVQPTNNGGTFAIGNLPFAQMGGNSFNGGSILYTDTGVLTGWRPLVWTGDSFVYFHVVTGSGVIRTNANWVTVNNNGPLIFTVRYYAA